MPLAFSIWAIVVLVVVIVLVVIAAPLRLLWRLRQDDVEPRAPTALCGDGKRRRHRRTTSELAPAVIP
jgi:hypothetical protein